MEEPFEHDEDELEKIRLENEIKKIKLSLEHGMDLSHSYTDEELPPEVEGAFLDHIKQWEEQFAQRKRIAVYDFIGRPGYLPLSGMETVQVKPQLERIMEIMK